MKQQVIVVLLFLTETCRSPEKRKLLQEEFRGDLGEGVKKVALKVLKSKQKKHRVKEGKAEEARSHRWRDHINQRMKDFA